ncbi:MAG TPA: TMEM175 family protein [Solirubrobacteraceae bacterium]|nr:TMEM175 family protein [Solirubrobacteraceae bacterium]
MSTNRLESFSDAVIAVAITLLVLNIAVPTAKSNQSLAHALGQQWPIYAAYVTSFVTIGIIWINHHTAISRLKRADHSVLVINLLLLMSIAVLPFSTSLMAAYLKASSGQHLAAAVYSGMLLLMSLLFSLLNRHILFAEPDLVGPELSRERRRIILRRGVTGLAPYAVATGLAPVTPYATLAICAAVAAFYALPVAQGN